MEYRLPKDDIITVGISLLKFVGEFTTYKSQLPINIYRAFNCFVMISNAILVLANIPNADEYMYIQIISSSGQFAHGLLRYICFLYYKPEIYKLLTDLELFWNVKQVEHTHRLGKWTKIFFKVSPKMFVMMGVLDIIAYSFKPLPTKGGLMFPARIVFDFVGFQAALLFSQYYFLIIVVAIAIGYDIIYICYSAHVIIQLRMLKCKFERITHDMDIKTINSYIRHHQFMLKIFDRMKGIYFWLFFFLYGITLLTGCCQLYILILRDIPIYDLLGSLAYIISLFVEFGLFTSIVEEIVSQFTDIASSVYKSPWYERTLEERKVLLFITMKAQRQSYFSAAGFAEINVDAFGSLTRRMFSFYAILKNVLSN